MLVAGVVTVPMKFPGAISKENLQGRCVVIHLSPIQLAVRCFAELKDGQWQAFSLEFGLAAQGESFADVRRSLESMIVSYVKDALDEDREHAMTLLKRKAMWQVYAKYYFHVVIGALKERLGGQGKLKFFLEPLSLEPRSAST
jgi:predicted RNase H-like HicB family nuclease